MSYGGGRGGGAAVAPTPLAANRVLLPVTFLTSCAVATAHSVAHFFMVAENESRLPPGKKPQKRVAVIADRTTFQSDIDVAVSRCVSFSQITEISVQEDHLSPLIGPFCEYDTLLQQSTVIDFVRTIAAVFKPNGATSAAVPTFVVEDGGLSSRVLCRLSPNALQDVVGTAAQEAAQRSIRTAKDREIAALQEALAKQKEESLLEMVDLHTQNETLKHSLSQAEQALMSARRAGREEKELLVAKLRQAEAERDAARGAPVRSPIGSDRDAMHYQTATPPPPIQQQQQQGSAQFGSGGGHFFSPAQQQQQQQSMTSPAPSFRENNSRGYGASPGAAASCGVRPGSSNYSASAASFNGAQGSGWVHQPAPHAWATSGSGGGYGAAGAPGAATPSRIGSTLDHLQSQLNEGERFLHDLRSHRQGGSAYR